MQALQHHQNKVIKCTDPQYAHPCKHCHKRFTRVSIMRLHEATCTRVPPPPLPDKLEQAAVELNAKVDDLARSIVTVDSALEVIEKLVHSLKMCDPDFNIQQILLPELCDNLGTRTAVDEQYFSQSVYNDNRVDNSTNIDNSAASARSNRISS